MKDEDQPVSYYPFMKSVGEFEVFFRRAKQDLGMADCHSTTEDHHHAHLELLFTADTLLGYANWQLNKEKTSDEEGYTHGEIFHTRCQIRLMSPTEFKRSLLILTQQ